MPELLWGAPVASSSSLPLLPPPFNDWRQPGIGSSKLPPPPRAPPPTPNTFTRVQIPCHYLRRRHRRQRRHRRNFARTPLTKRRWRRREVRARSVYYSKLLSATTGRAPPPAVGVAAASRTRTKRSIGHRRGSARASTVPSGTRSTLSRVCPWPVRRRRRRRRVPSPYARDTLHFVHREITR